MKGEKVVEKNHGRGEKWLPGDILGKSVPLSFQVKIVDGQVIRYHQDHLRKWHCDNESDLLLQEEISKEISQPK